jgi:hypothetical protein
VEDVRIALTKPDLHLLLLENTVLKRIRLLLPRLLFLYQQMFRLDLDFLAVEMIENES